MIDCVIDVKDEKRKEVIDENKSDESEAFFIFSMINCVINVEDKMREEIINRNKSDESKSREIQESERNKNENNITEEHVSITTKTF